MVHADKVEDIIALLRNTWDWEEHLPPKIVDQLVHWMYYGHFVCHVLHQDYIMKKRCDPNVVKADMLKLLDQRGAECPAEHNGGHLYKAKRDLAAFYREVDPSNAFNPGIGKMWKRKHYGTPKVEVVAE